VERGAVLAVRQRGALFVDIGDRDDMGRQIPGSIERRLLRVARRDRPDAGFADFRLERNFEAARLHHMLLEPESSLHAHHLATGRVGFGADNLIELA
jgi:hypothetical protein